MFDDLIKTLKSLDGMNIRSEIHADEDGYIDRQCPHEECEYLFKIKEDDLFSDLVSDEKVWCPLCGHQANAQSWYSKEQVEQAQKVAFAEVGHIVNEAMIRDARNFNSKQPKNSFLSMSMKVTRKSKEVILPAKPTDLMQLRIQCNNCSCNYAVIGSTYFCPACGSKSSTQIFQQSIETIRTILDNLDELTENIPDKDTQQNMQNSFIESSLQKCVTTFQTFADNLVANNPSRSKYRQNAFQNIAEGSQLWGSLYGHEYNNYLSEGELEDLNLFFQKRHILVHNDGIVDEKYIQKSSDKTFKLGQRIIVNIVDVEACLKLVENLGTAMNKECQKNKQP